MCSTAVLQTTLTTETKIRSRTTQRIPVGRGRRSTIPQRPQAHPSLARLSQTLRVFRAALLLEITQRPWILGPLFMARRSGLVRMDASVVLVRSSRTNGSLPHSPRIEPSHPTCSTALFRLARSFPKQIIPYQNRLLPKQAICASSAQPVPCCDQTSPSDGISGGLTEINPSGVLHVRSNNRFLRPWSVNSSLRRTIAQGRVLPSAFQSSNLLSCPRFTTSHLGSDDW